MIYLNKGSSSSRAIYKRILRVIQNVWHGQDISCIFKRWPMQLKLGEPEVLSTKIFLKILEKMENTDQKKVRIWKLFMQWWYSAYVWYYVDHLFHKPFKLLFGPYEKYILKGIYIPSYTISHERMEWHSWSNKNVMKAKLHSFYTNRENWLEAEFSDFSVVTQHQNVLTSEAAIKGVLQKSCSQKFLNLRRKISVLESHYNSRSL